MASIAGVFNCQMEFQKRSLDETGDGAGNFEGDFETVFTEWVRRTFLRGGETVMAARLSGRQPAILRVRATVETREITTDWRLVNSENEVEIWNVRSVEPSEDRAFIDLLCERGVAT